MELGQAWRNKNISRSRNEKSDWSEKAKMPDGNEMRVRWARGGDASEGIGCMETAGKRPKDSLLGRILEPRTEKVQWEGSGGVGSPWVLTNALGNGERGGMGMGRLSRWMLIL